MFDVGGGELLLIFVAVLLLFGPKKIPEVMHSVGKGLRQFRQAQEDLKQQMRDLSADVEKMTQDPTPNISKPIISMTPNISETVNISEPVNISESPDTSEDMTTLIQEELPSEAEITQPVVTLKPAESTVSRNSQNVKKVFDDTVFDD